MASLRFLLFLQHLQIKTNTKTTKTRIPAKIRSSLLFLSLFLTHSSQLIVTIFNFPSWLLSLNCSQFKTHKFDKKIQNQKFWNKKLISIALCVPSALLFLLSLIVLLVLSSIFDLSCEILCHFLEINVCGLHSCLNN